ncbi:MAG TPA: threonine/serine exporter family protein, partial [Limosilactobacillus ingluviei]|nr:threonine/serine exporter family protein [Limosilactobacillus ingluviei]
DMRSGLERGAFALMVITVATLVGWVVAMAMDLQPENFIPLALSPALYLVLRLVFSFCGVFGFSIMFNSSLKMAATAGVIGACANTLRLEMVDLAHVPAGPAAFAGALLAGLLASLARRRVGYPRIAITVPSIVIMVPGLYMYSAVYNLGLNSLSVAGTWAAKAALIVVFLPLGLIAARIIADPKWRYKS